MQMLQKSNPSDSVYARLLTSAKDEEVKKRCPIFQVSQKDWSGYKSLGEFTKIGWYITEIKNKKKTVVINNKEEEKNIIQIHMYNDTEQRSCIIESSLNSVIKSILCKLVTVDFESDRVILCVYRNREWYPWGTVLDNEEKNIAFTDTCHPKSIIDDIRNSEKAKKLKEEYGNDTYTNYVNNESDKYYIWLVDTLADLPKYQKPSPTPVAEVIPSSTEPLAPASDDLSFLDDSSPMEDIPSEKNPKAIKKPKNMANIPGDDLPF